MYHIDPEIQMILPKTPMGLILFLKRKTERMIIVTCFTFPTTFIINGPPSFTALKLAMFNKKASMPWNTNKRILDIGALHSIHMIIPYLGNHDTQN